MRPVLVPFSLALVLTAAAAGEPTPSLTLVVLNKADNAMAIINPADGKVVATVPVGRNPHEAAVSDATVVGWPSPPTCRRTLFP
jgi:YVTN family beta-propeller protein